jgi:hypothetical protein
MGTLRRSRGVQFRVLTYLLLLYQYNCSKSLYTFRYLGVLDIPLRFRSRTGDVCLAGPAMSAVTKECSQMYHRT